MLEIAFLLLSLSVDPAAAPPPSLDEILVVGEQPGPAMWKIASGDHSLYILATLEPLPKHMVWRSRAVEDRVAASQLVLAPPSVSAHVGFFRTLTLVPSLLRARHDPDGRTLEQSLPHDLYIRWLALRVKYLGSSSDEKMRPMFAALDLYGHAVDAVGLTFDNTVWERVAEIAHAKHVTVQTVSIELPIDDPKRYVHDLGDIPASGEIACLDSTVGKLETNLPEMRNRANLWSAGDIGKLEANLHLDEPDSCVDALMVVPSFRVEYEKSKVRVQNEWLHAAAEALHNNLSTVALLPLYQLLGSNGVLEKFRAEGLLITAP